MKTLRMSAGALVIALIVTGCAHAPSRSLGANDTVFQVSTINALMLGLYDGAYTVGDLRRHGDIGLGTFNQLDGEMVVLDGEVFQVRSDGKAYRVADTTQTPFATVTAFEADARMTLASVKDFETLEHAVSQLADNDNLFHAIRITGQFKYVKTRAVPKQSKPYAPLVEVTKHQPEFELHDVSGTIVGFWTPAYAQGLNVAGYHLHFLNDARTLGGHLLDCTIEHAVLEIDTSRTFEVLLPSGDEFKNVNLNQDLSNEIRQVEKKRN